MSYFEDYQVREPRWTAYESSKYDSYDRPHDYGRREMTSLVPVRMIERGHVDPARSLQNTKTATFWDRSDNRVNYVVYPGPDDYRRPNSSAFDYDYDYYGRSATDDDDFRTSSYDYRRRSSSPNYDRSSHGRSPAYDYGFFSSSRKYSRRYDDDSDNYRSSSAISRRDDHHRYKSYDAYRYRC